MNYHTITYPDQNNGTGLRVVLWLSACSHHCYNCQNPQTWSPDSGIPFDELAKQEIFTELSKDYISGLTLTGGDPLHENNLDEVLKLVQEIRNSYHEKSIWLYTGYHVFINYPESHRQHKVILSTRPRPNTSTNIIYDNELFSRKKEEDRKRSEIISLCNVLVDGEYIDELRDITLAYRGSKNQRVIDINQTCTQNKIILYCD